MNCLPRETTLISSHGRIIDEGEEIVEEAEEEEEHDETLVDEMESKVSERRGTSYVRGDGVGT